MKKFFPIWLKDLVKKNLFISSKGHKLYYCPVCKNRLTRFNRLIDYYFEQLDKYQSVHSLFYFETFNILKYSCPKCSSSDRNRLYALFLMKKLCSLEKSGEKISFLDVAPEKSFTKWIKSFSFINYRSVDLNREYADDIADITDLKIYKDEMFDIILCSHVFEHIDDDRKAMAELYRVLKKNGFAILMAPILLSLEEDLENQEWTSEADRWKYCSQNDHVRMYSKKGFIDKLEGVGFKVTQYDINYFGEEAFALHGIHSRSVLYVGKKH